MLLRHPLILLAIVLATVFSFIRDGLGVAAAPSTSESASLRIAAPTSTQNSSSKLLLHLLGVMNYDGYQTLPIHRRHLHGSPKLRLVFYFLHIGSTVFFSSSFAYLKSEYNRFFKTPEYDLLDEYESLLPSASSAEAKFPLHLMLVLLGHCLLLFVFGCNIFFALFY